MIRPERWPDLLQAYLMVAAGRGAFLPMGALRKRLGPQLDILLLIGATEPGPPLSIVTCPACFEGHTAEIDYNPATRRSSIFCVEAGRVDMANEDLATIRSNLRWLPDQITCLLGVRSSPPRRTLIEGTAWWLGDIVVGKTEVSVALAVGVRSTGETQQLIDTLRQRPPPGPGLLLVADDVAPAHVGDLTGYQPVPIDQIIRADGEALGADEVRLNAWVRTVLRGQISPKGGRGGRPSTADQVLSIFRARRQRGEPFINKTKEARRIQDEWLAHFPDQDPPALTTMRAQLPTPESQ